ncbi:WecB/TagA/CpsF family glycosyltransferase [Methylorubrum salsuginis]|uniref:Polymer biosynthesis protein, WecB/TagA/CpsF family n=1 Tax=Methylorubrum salsuginis TaxID=414703 RepID=A0A1I4LR68_9HYPH|nr:WecB/TagA/CpsF family glycosyltransferase [Methylorubrum salsuginis]SFL93439.1 polymer biosynthesis protein, WecB/TagA/CpsF family [Methylorubrum salsuginis]
MRKDSAHLAFKRTHFLRTPFDAVEPDDLVALLSRTTSAAPFRYVVTPNVDHVVRLRQTVSLVTHYEAAWLSLCDSRPIALLARLLGEPLPQMAGSTLTARLFRDVIRPGDRIAVVAADATVAAQLRQRFPKIDFAVMVAPADVGGNADRLQACADFVVRARARFAFIAIGSPQSERIAFRAALDPDATGLALCVGAALEFLVGRKARAPLWMQRSGLEWTHRLACEPRRLWRRYVFRVLPLARLVLIECAHRLAARRPAARPVEG